MMLAPYSVHNIGDNDDRRPNNRSPIGCARSHRQVARETAPDLADVSNDCIARLSLLGMLTEQEGRVEQSEAVDCETEASQTPTRIWQRVAFQSLQKDAANAEHVRGHEAEYRKRDDDVESERASKLNERQDHAACGASVYCVERDVTLAYTWVEVVSKCLKGQPGIWYAHGPCGQATRFLEDRGLGRTPTSLAHWWRVR